MNKEQLQKAKELIKLIETLKYKLENLEKDAVLYYGNTAFKISDIGEETKSTVVTILKVALQSRLEKAEKEFEEL